MAILKPPRVRTDALYWSQVHHTFSADLSDLGRDFRFGRVYDDACDVGLTLVSARTGVEIICAVSREERDAEGELRAYHLRPVIEQAHRSNVTNWTVVLYND